MRMTGWLALFLIGTDLFVISPPSRGGADISGRGR
jgi:hypothetical protein